MIDCNKINNNKINDKQRKLEWRYKDEKNCN